MTRNSVIKREKILELLKKHKKQDPRCDKVHDVRMYMYMAPPLPLCARLCVPVGGCSSVQDRRCC